jgi:short subunit dehydrogenase-like uncharacterized protein
MFAESVNVVRAALHRWVLPKPGEGPSEQERTAGSFRLILLGIGGPQGQLQTRVIVRGDRDPGYGGTSRMIGESAACLAADSDHLPVAGGFWTPASCLGDRLVERLAARGGIHFDVQR